MRLFPCLLLILSSLPAFALGEADRAAAEAVVAYGQAHRDQGGLVVDPTGTPNLPESTAGYVVACFETGQQLDHARQVLGLLLDYQRTSGKQEGHFPWQVPSGVPAGECVISESAILYMAPLLARLQLQHADAVGPELQPRLRQSLDLAARAVGKLSASPQDDARYLLRAAARATLGAALGTEGPAAAAGEVANWLRFVTVQGLPQGHSATFDAARYVAVKWVREVAPEAQRPALDQALTLLSVDLAGRVHPAARYLAGALAQAFPTDYASAAGFAGYVVHTDFGQPLPAEVEPYLMAALLPQWRAPRAVADLTEGYATGTRRTNAVRSTIAATDTYVGTSFSLGTMSGEVGASTIPVFCTFGHSARPTMYFFCTPTPCTVQSVQAEALAMCSVNFDGVGTREAIQASLRGVLGTAEDIEEVYAYGNKWNDLPTSLGERESVALRMHGCFVGLTMMRTGVATSQEGSPGKPISLKWSEPERKGDLLLTIYARQAEYSLTKPQHNMRAGVIIEIVPDSAYPSLEEFSRHLGDGKLRQSVKALTQRVPAAEKPRDPNVIVPEPRAKIDMVYRSTLEQTSEYTLAGRTLTVVEDLLGNIGLQRKVDEVVLDPTFLWESDFFKLQSGGKLSEALTPFLQQ